MIDQMLHGFIGSGLKYLSWFFFPKGTQYRNLPIKSNVASKVLIQGILEPFFGVAVDFWGDEICGWKYCN